MRSRQFLRLPARLCDHPVREGRHEARSLGEREEIGRRHEAFAVLPADERFGADDLAGVQADERLVVEDEAVAALDRRAQAPGHRKLRERVVAVERIEGMAVAARVLRAVHRGVRVLQESLRVRRVVGEEADADRGADEDLHAGDDEGSQQRAADLPRDDRGGLAGVLGVVLVAVRLDVGEEDEELVASLAGDYVGGARRALKASRDRAQELVAGRVAEAVVDQLEVVQVDEEDAGRALLSGTAVERLVQPLLEGDAVGQAGERVVEGDVLELAARLLEGVGRLPPLGDVGDDPVDEELAPGPAPRAHAVPDPACLPVVADQAVLDLDRLAGLELREDVVRLLVVRVDGFLPRLLGRLVLGKWAEEALEPLADERVADIRPVLEVLGLVEMDGDGAGDAAEYIRCRERFVQRVGAVVRNGGGIGHG